jgi:hypothetical protein
VIDDEGDISGAPDLLAQIAASTASHDVTDKRLVYQRNGVREYIVWRVLDRRVDWYVSRGTGYERLPVGDDGFMRRIIFSASWLDVGALLRKDYGALLDALQRGLETAEHANFKAELQRGRTAPRG